MVFRLMLYALKSNDCSMIPPCRNKTVMT
jgi:hypothetical protein